MSLSIKSGIPTIFTTNPKSLQLKQEQDFKALATALQSGNLESAKSAFSAFQTDLSSQGKGINKLLSDLGNAVNAGDLQSARADFYKISGSKSHGGNHLGRVNLSV